VKLSLSELVMHACLISAHYLVPCQITLSGSRL
jgi:hypothetical protein